MLRSFMFIKQKFFPNGDMDKLKARLVADGNQQGRHLYDADNNNVLRVFAHLKSISANAD